MTVIKAADLLARRARAPQIRLPALAPGHAAPSADPARLALEARVAALEAELAQSSVQAVELREALAAREAESARAATAHAEALVAAEADGRAAGLVDGAEAKAAHLQVLEAAAARALDQLRGDLGRLEALAVALSRAALSKVFGEEGDLAARVARLVRRQLSELERAAVIRIEVSAADFPDPAALAALSAQAGLEGIEAQALEGLSRGDCRIRLRLGELEVGIGQQWGRLSALLDDALATDEAG